MKPAPPVTRIFIPYTLYLVPEVLDGVAESLLEPDLRLPAEEGPRARDVGLALLRVVDRQRPEHDLAPRVRERLDALGKLEDRHLRRVATVDRAAVVRPEQPHDALDQVGDEAEDARLRAVAVDGDGLAAQRLGDEVRPHAPVAQPHARSVRVEDAHDARRDAVRAVIGHG